ncbi:siderophore ABC transporter substrate-binding protein [Glutamicibacter uratoxydans]|uniref:siderophore ABC transporter substrate-binding protein n=1 Tax=Glutamicibacter uratoxydans TaxID=43667 RepID=UPI003D6FB313
MASLKLRAAALLSIAALSLTACGSTASGAADSSAPATEGGTVTVTDSVGEVTVTTNPQSVVATDNNSFETLDSWGVELTAGAVALMPTTVSYKDNAQIVDLGNHREPNLEAVVAAEPDLIITGSRFTQYTEDFKKLAPEAAVVQVDRIEGKPLADELKRTTSVLGEVFGKQDEATKLNADLDAAIERAKSAYDSDQKVMAVITSGGTVNYAAPGEGRTLGPLFGLLGLTPALDISDASSNHEGDDISVEAIASSNPDWILVMDRDAGTTASAEEGYTPANELLANSAALQNVTAVKEGNIVYMPADTYTNEGIQTYTEYLNTLADAFEAK